jgi:hypothetical protein
VAAVDDRRRMQSGGGEAGTCDAPTIDEAVAGLNRECCPRGEFKGTCIGEAPTECPPRCALRMADVKYGACAQAFDKLFDVTAIRLNRGQSGVMAEAYPAYTARNGISSHAWAVEPFRRPLLYFISVILVCY